MRNLLIIVLVLSMTSCFPPKEVKPTRITVMEEATINGHGYTIVMIDGVEYVANGNTGGICPLVKPTK